MTCLSPIWINGASFRCGKCSECLKLERLMWTVRMDAEMRSHDKNCFLTLTYDDQHLPDGQNLDKARMVKLWKNFRTKWPLRYFCAGEYGSEGGRPHYHVAMFGVDRFHPCFHGLKYDNQRHIWRGSMNFWPDGEVAVGNLTSRSIQYIGKYILKKVGAKDDRSDGRVKEFRTMSRRPGLGYDFIRANADSLRARGTYILDGQEVPLPRYFVDYVLSDDDRLRLMNKVQDKIHRDWLEGKSVELINRDQLALNSVARSNLYVKKGKLDVQTKDYYQEHSLPL